MNNIKRAKEGTNILLAYKFGKCKYVDSDKLLLTSVKNRRIVLNKNIIFYFLYRNCFTKELIKTTVTEENINLLNNYTKNTPLHVALESKYPEDIIRLLISEKNVLMGNLGRDTPLHIAVGNNYPIDIIRLLITEETLDMKNNYNNTPLYIALIRRHSEEVIRLLITKKNVNIEPRFRNPLYAALENNYSPEIIEAIIAAGASSIGKNIIDLAIKQNYPASIIDILKKKMINCR